MAATMRHWVCVISLGLAWSACKDERAIEAAPVPAERTATPSQGDASDEPKADGDGGGLFLKRVKVEVAPSHPGGLFGVTREMIDTVRRKETTPVQLVPDAAIFVARMRPAVLLAHAEAQAVWTKAEASDPSFQTAMDVVRACLGRLEAVDDVVLGFEDREHLVLAAHAKGIGTDAVWQCVRTETVARGKSFDLVTTGTARGEGPQLRGDDGSVGYFPDDDTMVMVTTAWDADVQARLRGEGTPAIAGGLASVVSRIGLDDPLWLVGRLGGKPELELAGTPFAGIDDVAFDLSMEGSDLRLDTTMDAGEASDATRVRDDIRRQFEPIKGVLPVMGVPPSLVPKLEFVAEGELVRLTFTLTSDELRSLREVAERSL